MKNHIGFSAVTLLITASIIPVLALAAEIRTGEQPSVSASEKIIGDLYMAGGNISSHGAIAGDLVLGGGNILVNSAVEEDLMAGGGSITILGIVGDDVRVAGGNIIISGGVKGDVVAGGGQTQISGSGVGGDIIWGGGTLSVDAPVAGNLKLAGGEVTIHSTIHGNVEFRGEKLTLGKDAVIDGNLTYTSPNEVVIEEGAVVKGATSYEPRTSRRDVKKNGIAAILSLVLIGKLLSSLVSALVVGLLFRRYAAEMLKIATSQPLVEMGRGLVVLIVLPVVSVILLVTVLGIPFGVVGLLSFAALLIFAPIVAPIILGSIVHKRISKPEQYLISWQTILLGVVLYQILVFIPLVGWIGTFLLCLLVIGSMMKMKWSVLKEWR